MRKLILLLITTPAFGQVPHVFEPNTPALAEEVNENFDVVDDWAKRSFVIYKIAPVTDVSGVASALCPDLTTQIPISANCDCQNEIGVENFGGLFMCQLYDDGAVAGCFNEASLFDPNLLHVPATVHLDCFGVVDRNGDPLPIVDIENAKTQFFSLKTSGAKTEEGVNRARSVVSARQ